MIKIKEILKQNNLRAKKIEKKGKATIIETEDKKIVIKKSHIKDDILIYLKSRNFDYYPNIIENKDYYIEDYIKEYNIPKEQKLKELIKIVGLLHSKTTYYKKIDIEKNEKLYNDINNNINYLYSYYTDLITLIETKVFMSPSESFFSNNITKLYDLLDESKKKLETWHELIKEKTKERNVVIHNNLNIDNFIRNEKSYLISWEKSKIDLPIFDIYKLYKNSPEIDIEEILNNYEKIYPLTKDEKLLLELLIQIPEDIEIKGTEYNKCQIINNILKKTKLPETFEKRKKEKQK